VPGTYDDWNHVTFASLRRAATSIAHRRATGTTLPDAPETGAQVAPDGEGTARERAGRPRRRRVVIAAVSAGALVVAGAGVAVAAAHKVVTLDVDGQERRVSTFAGDVDALLADRELALGTHDTVAPTGETPLRDGQTVVVRHAHEIEVQLDGAPTAVWTTALSADEALAGLRERGADVRLTVSRSTQGRAELPLDLATSGPVDVTADGRTLEVPGAQDAAGALAAAGVTLAAEDRVQVLHDSADGRLTLLVQRVVTAQEAVATEVPFATQTRKAADLTVGRTKTLQAGANGVRTQTYLVTRVDGVEESRRMIFDAVTAAPVDKVVAEGTKPRAVAAAPAGGGAVGGDVWAALAACESGGNPAAVSRSGAYHGLYQFSVSTWRAMGGSGLPSEASAAEQTERAQALQARSGWGQWPACAKKLGLL
jgi:uncharacterized protein YabE (DUF348 family)